MAKRKHHYLSRFYLGGFTPSGSKEDLLYVTSKRQGRQWRDQAQDVAHQRDLFRPERADFDPDEIEDGFSDVEDVVAPVLKEVVTRKTLPLDSRQRSLLLHLPALNGARPPAEIAAFEARIDLEMRRLLVEELTPERYERVIQEWVRDGKDPAVVHDREKLQEWLIESGVKLKFDKDTILGAVLERSAKLVDLLHQRRWSLLIADYPATEFVCSDRPVTPSK